MLVAKGGREAASATLSEAGEILWQGRAYRPPSDMAFAPLLGVTKFNGWEYWRAELTNGRRTLAVVRASFMEGRDDRDEPGQVVSATS